MWVCEWVSVCVCGNVEVGICFVCRDVGIGDVDKSLDIYGRFMVRLCEFVFVSEWVSLWLCLCVFG